WRDLGPVCPRHAVGLGPHSSLRAGDPVPWSARCAAAGHAPRRGTRVPGRMEGAAAGAGRSVCSQAADRVERQREASEARVEQEPGARLIHEGRRRARSARCLASSARYGAHRAVRGLTSPEADATVTLESRRTAEGVASMWVEMKVRGLALDPV